jgi:hypothetical protein
MANTVDTALVLHSVCAALLDHKPDAAQALLKESVPFTGSPAVKRQYSELVKTQVFLRDGFIDRYTGKKLVFIGALRLISHLMPETFPYHPAWKMEICHPAYWELVPTLDHIVPVARGGQDTLENWVTSSMLTNARKGSWTLEAMGWTLLPPGDQTEWDGLMRTFMRLVEADKSLLEQEFIRRNYRSAKAALAAP